MHLLGKRTAQRRGLVCVVAMALCAGPIAGGSRAQESAPVAGSATIASAGEPVLLRESPGYDAVAVQTLGDGGALEVIGEPAYAGDGSAWLPVVTGGQSGYVPAGYVVAPSAGDPAPVAAEVAPVAEPAPALETTAATDPATTKTDANLRASPSGEADVLQVIAPGTPISVDGAAQNGFVHVTANGATGWVAVELLAQGTEAAAPEAAGLTMAEPPPLVATEDGAAPLAVNEDGTVPEAAPVAAPVQGNQRERHDSTGITWPFAGGEWTVVQGYNGATHTNRGGFAQYKYALDWARSDDNTAGQPVYAPVSGTIQWLDRGSGGILIDAGNGYGMALFHVTYNGRLSRGGEVERGQQIGQISGPGGDGYMSMAHIEIDSWRLSDGGHESVPFTGPNAIAGQEFPDTGGSNQHMGATVTP